MKDTYTVAYAAEKMGVQKETLRTLLKKREVPFGIAIRGAGGKWSYVIPKGAFDRFMNIGLYSEEPA